MRSSSPPGVILRPLRSVLAGLAGTVALTPAYRLEHRLRPRTGVPVDYADRLSALR